MDEDRNYDALAAKLAEVKASSQGWIDAAVEQQVRRKRAEARLLEVKVKALVWTECNSGNFKQGHCFTARSMVDFAPIAVHKKSDGWWLNKDCTTYPTIEAAKAAAQADYEARIMSALEPDTPLNDPLVKALAEAATELHDKAVEKHQRHRSDIWPVIRKLRAALSALEENK